LPVICCCWVYKNFWISCLIFEFFFWFMFWQLIILFSAHHHRSERPELLVKG
jgi:hypothetical protein